MVERTCPARRHGFKKAGPAAEVTINADTTWTIDPRSILFIGAGTWFEPATLSGQGTPGAIEEGEAAALAAEPGGPDGLP